MKSRYFLAMLLTFGVMLAWSNFVVKPNLPQQVPAQPVKTQEPAVVEQPNETCPPLNISPFSLPQAEINFIDNCGAIQDITFTKYDSYKLTLKKGLLIPENCNYIKKVISKNEIVFVQSDNKKKFTKHFTFSENSYDFALTLEIENLSNEAVDIKDEILLGTLDSSVNGKKNIGFYGVHVAENNRQSYPNIHKDATFDRIRSIGFRDRYFCAIIQPLSGEFSGKIRKVNSNESDILIVPMSTNLLPGQSLKLNFRIYLGPQDLEILKNSNPEWTNIVYFGAFDFIAKLALNCLKLIFNFVHNWGLAIIILSILIFVILFPLTMQQIKSMKEMQALQPHLEKLRKLYKDNPQKLNKESIELYKQHKVNPLGGCLPPLLQMPLLIALYQALNRSIVLKGAQFLWIKDLSEPDSLIILGTQLPLIENKINLLPILTAVNMFIQQKSSMASTGGANPDQQKMMMIIFPIMFGMIFYNFPAGVVLYWFVNGLLMVLFQLRMVKKNV